MPWDHCRDTRLLESSVSALSLCVQRCSGLCRIVWSNLRSLIRDALSSIPYLISSDYPPRWTLSYSTHIMCIPSPTLSGISWKKTLLVCSAQFEAKDSLSIVRAPTLMTTRILPGPSKVIVHVQVDDWMFRYLYHGRPGAIPQFGRRTKSRKIPREDRGYREWYGTH